MILADGLHSYSIVRNCYNHKDTTPYLRPVSQNESKILFFYFFNIFLLLYSEIMIHFEKRHHQHKRERNMRILKTGKDRVGEKSLDMSFINLVLNNPTSINDPSIHLDPFIFQNWEIGIRFKKRNTMNTEQEIALRTLHKQRTYFVSCLYSTTLTRQSINQQIDGCPFKCVDIKLKTQGWLSSSCPTSGLFH